MISDERLQQLADEGTICKVSWDERIAVARELLALRKAFSEPVGYVHRIYERMETGVITKDHEAFSGDRLHIPLFRKPS